MAKKLATERGGVCLSSEYIDAKSPLEWQCSYNHTWFAPYNRIKNGAWCRKCADIEMAKRRSRTLEDARKIAEEKGGECLSVECENSHSILQWKCAKGHVWEAELRNVRRSVWCPTCNGENGGKRRL